MKLGFKKGEKGFTLIELMVVMAIMAVLAAIVFPTVTGTTTVSREVNQTEDINATQTGVDRFNTDDSDGSPWPTDASSANATITWSAGELPTGSGPSGSGNSTSPYVFTQDDIAGIDFDSSATVSGVSKNFYPDYLRNKPGDADTTITVADGATSANFTIKKGGSDVVVQLSNDSGVSFDFSAWGLDKDGGVWVFVDADSY
jgi:prepilin-type N-terminal cleavage/methylation domain-containing protein